VGKRQKHTRQLSGRTEPPLALTHHTHHISDHGPLTQRILVPVSFNCIHEAITPLFHRRAATVRPFRNYLTMDFQSWCVKSLRSPRHRRKREEAVQGNTAGALKALVCSMAFFGGYSSASHKFGRNDVSHDFDEVNDSNHSMITTRIYMSLRYQQLRK